MTAEEANEVMDRIRVELIPMLRRAMLGVAAVSAFIGAMVALIVLSLVAAAR